MKKSSKVLCCGFLSVLKFNTFAGD